MDISGSSNLTLLDSRPGEFAFYGWNNVTLIIWPTQATGYAVERLTAVTERMIGIFAQGVSNIHVVANGAPLPTAEARAGFVDIMKRHEARLACVAVVLEGSGFWAATLRSVITGMRMVSPRTFPMRFHESIAEVPRWLPKEHERLTGTELIPDGLYRALAEARTFLDAGPRVAAR